MKSATSWLAKPVATSAFRNPSGSNRMNWTNELDTDE
jgi:hypothetical protein